MSTADQFANLVISLRAPRVALCIDDDQFVPLAMSALRAQTQLWGGAGNTVIVTKEGQLHPGVSRALRAYDPDYVASLALSLRDAEDIFPGYENLLVDGQLITDPAERAEFIATAEQHGPTVSGMSVAEATLSSVSKELTAFQDEGEPRIFSLHPQHLDDRLVTPVPSTPFVTYATGDANVDLAIGLKRGVPMEETDLMSVGEGISRGDIVQILCSDIQTDETSPFGPTVDGLSWIRRGYHRGAEPIIVLGRAGSDMALAATLDRARRNTFWLPFADDDEEWFRDLGATLVSRRRQGHKRQFIVTSTSLDENECMSLFNKIVDASFVVWPVKDREAMVYCAPESLPLGTASGSWRVDDQWDVRFTAPMTSEGGSVHFSTPPPLEVPGWYDPLARRWIYEVTCERRPTHAHPAVTPQQLLAPGEDTTETFVRTSGTSLSFESARWGLVVAGSSHAGQLARPKLRWPGIRETLTTAAGTAGSEVRPSAPGKIASLTTTLWGGRAELIRDLLPDRRPIVDLLLTEHGPDRPLEKEAEVGEGVPRIRLHNRCLVPYSAFNGYAADLDARAWLDARLMTGSVRTGLVLSCGVCPWGDFYPIDDVGTSFTCVRCGSLNWLTHARWRKPDTGPIWYYELHPTAAQFFEQHGDGPLLAVHHHHASQNSDEIEFELEFVDTKTAKPWVEIDFAIHGWQGLVLGEAKTNGTLDGKNAKARVADVKKLLTAAKMVDASEVCFATFGTWNPAARTAFKEALSVVQPSAFISLLENIETVTSTRTVL